MWANNLSSDGEIELEILDEAQYWYVASTNTIDLFDTRSFLRIKNSPFISVGLAAGNAELIRRIVRTNQLNSGSININFVSLIGLLPFGNAYSTFFDIYGAFSYANEASSSGTLIYHDTVAASVATYGNSNRGHEFTIPSNIYLASEGDRLTFVYTIQEPTDDPVNPGYHSIYYRYNFKIFSRNWLGLYTIEEASIDKGITESYLVTS